MTEKKQNRAKNLATITFVASNEMEVRTIAHLKKVKDKSGVEIKAQILRAVTSLTGLYSIGDDPNCTRREFEDATVNFIIDLTTHLNRGLSYAKNHKHQIQLPPSSWTQFCQIADSIFPGGSDDLGGKSTIVPIIGDLPKSQDLIVKQDEDEDEDEDYSDLSNEEYMALMQSKTITPQVKN
jgi:hypothetical protein